MSPPSFTPWNVYASELVRLGYGHPLWYPEPTKFGEVEIGDVGVVQEGRFFRLFNAMRDEDDPVNARGVPEGFVKLSVDDDLCHRLPNCLPKGPVCSKSTKRVYAKAEVSVGAVPAVAQVGGGYSFTMEGKKGAVAVLNGHGVQEKIMSSSVAFEDYILTHNPSWADFARKKGLRVRPQDIVLVSGWIKTTEWALSAYASEGQSHELSFSIAAGGYASADCAFTVEKSANISMSERLGPRPAGSEDSSLSEPRSDQCLFLRYYKCCYRGLGVVKLSHVGLREHAVMEDEMEGCRCAPDFSVFNFRGRTPKVSKEETKLSRLYTDLRPSIVASSPIEVPSDEYSDDPLDSILAYIAENTDATQAVVCHDDAETMFAEWQHWPEDISLRDYLNRTRPNVVVDLHGAHLANPSRISRTPQTPILPRHLGSTMSHSLPTAASLPPGHRAIDIGRIGKTANAAISSQPRGRPVMMISPIDSASVPDGSVDINHPTEFIGLPISHETHTLSADIDMARRPSASSRRPTRTDSPKTLTDDQGLDTHILPFSLDTDFIHANADITHPLVLSELATAYYAPSRPSSGNISVTQQPVAYAPAVPPWAHPLESVAPALQRTSLHPNRYSPHLMPIYTVADPAARPLGDGPRLVHERTGGGGCCGEPPEGSSSSACTIM